MDARQRDFPPLAGQRDTLMLVLGLQRGPGVAQGPARAPGFYRFLLTAVAVPTFRRGRWQPCDRSGWPDINSYDNLVPCPGRAIIGGSSC